MCINFKSFITILATIALTGCSSYIPLTEPQYSKSVLNEDLLQNIKVENKQLKVNPYRRIYVQPINKYGVTLSATKAVEFYFSISNATNIGVFVVKDEYLNYINFFNNINLKNKSITYTILNEPNEISYVMTNNLHEIPKKQVFAIKTTETLKEIFTSRDAVENTTQGVQNISSSIDNNTDTKSK